MATMYEVLQSLLSQAGQGIQDNGGNIAETAGKALLAPLLSSNAVGNMPLATAKEAGSPQASDGGTGFGPNSQQTEKIKLDPFQEGVAKYAKEAGYNQSKIAHEAHGRPMQEVLEYTGVAPATGSMTTQTSQQPGQDEIINLLNGFIQQQQQAQQAPTQGRLLPATSMFSGGGIDANNNITQPGVARQIIGSLIPMLAPGSSVSENIDKAAKLQQIQGRQPYQQGAREEQLLKGNQAIESARATAQAKQFESLSPTDSAKLSALMEGRDATNSLSNFLLGGDDAQGMIVGNKFTPAFFKGDGMRRYDSALEIAIQAKTRAETGAAMPPSDLKNTMKRYKPRVGDSTETIKARLKPLYGYFDRGIQMADPNGIHQSRATKTEQFSQKLNAINQALAKRGIK